MRLVDRFLLWLEYRRQAKFERWLKTNRVRMPAPDRTCQRSAFTPEPWVKPSRRQS